MIANSPGFTPSSTSCLAAYPATIPPPRITNLDPAIAPPTGQRLRAPPAMLVSAPGRSVRVLMRLTCAFLLLVHCPVFIFFFGFLKHLGGTQAAFRGQVANVADNVPRFLVAQN